MKSFDIKMDVDEDVSSICESTVSVYRSKHWIWSKLNGIIQNFEKNMKKMLVVVKLRKVNITSHLPNNTHNVWAFTCFCLCIVLIDLFSYLFELQLSLSEGCRLPVRMSGTEDWPLAEIISIREIEGHLLFYVHYVDCE